METLVAISLALVPPVLLGVLCFNLLVPVHTAGRGALVWGHGALFGLLALTLLLRGIDALGYGLDSRIAIGAIFRLLVAFTLLNLFVGRWRSTAPATTWTTGTRLLFAALLALVLLRVVSLGMEIAWRPLFPWDATMHWATKARVWLAEGAMVPFVDHATWAAQFGEGVYTDRNPHYPATIPLLQVWMCLPLGNWDESQMNLPWLVCYIALGLMFFGHLRLAGLGAVAALAFTYLLLSMPLLNIHVALAGYADLFLGATYGAAIMFFFHWCQDRAPWKFVAMVGFLLLCPMLKNEGTIWAAILAPAFMAMILPHSQRLKFGLLVLLLAILAVLVIPENMVIAGTTLIAMTPNFDPEALNGIAKSVWLHDNWHLLGYLLLCMIPMAIVLRERVMQDHFGLILALGAAVGAFLYLFLFTGYADGAKDLSAVGRLCMHLAPGLMFMAALFYRDLVARDAA